MPSSTKQQPTTLLRLAVIIGITLCVMFLTAFVWYQIAVSIPTMNLVQNELLTENNVVSLLIRMSSQTSGHASR